MHVMVAFELVGEDGLPKPAPEFGALLHRIGFVKVMANVFVGSVADQNEIDWLHGILRKVRDTFASELTYVLSPAIRGGAYRGVLSERLWPELNKMSKEEGFLSLLGRTRPHISEETRRILSAGKSGGGHGG
jgi:hypothetical protein